MHRPLTLYSSFQRFTVAFSTLWSLAHEDNPDGTHAHPSAEDHDNQCAIHLGKTLIDAGIKLNNYTVFSPLTTEGYPRGAKSLADWLDRNFTPKPKKFATETEFQESYGHSTGILLIGKLPGGADHIDLYNDGKTGSGYYDGSSYWFWEIK